MKIRAVLFDVFGTVVDWRRSVISQCEAFGKQYGIETDWGAFADAWRGLYRPFMDRVRRGELPWTNLDALHRMALKDVLAARSIPHLDDDAQSKLNLVWHRLDPWPDSVPGLYRIKHHHIIAPMSNGNVALLTHMAKHAGLPWDCILGAEVARHYKPDPESYLVSVQLLGLTPPEVMMVAAHPSDLRAAGKLGLKTGFVPRPMELGPDRTPDLTPDPSFDLVATDFMDLADQLSGI